MKRFPAEHLAPRPLGSLLGQWAEVGRWQQLCRPFAAGMVVPTPPPLPARVGGRCPPSVLLPWCHSSCAAEGDGACGELGASPQMLQTPPHLSQWHPVRQREGVPRIAEDNLIFWERVGLAVESPVGGAAAGSWSEVLELWPLHGSCDSLNCVGTSPALTGFLDFARFTWSVLVFPVGAGLGEVRAGRARAVPKELSWFAGPARRLGAASILPLSGSGDLLRESTSLL